jgi:hypothetical protein
MALEHRTSVTTTIDPDGYILLRFLTEIWHDNVRIKEGTIYRTTIAPGDKIPDTITVPDVGEVSVPAEIGQYASAAHTPERVAKHKSRPKAATIAPPRKV